jgi:Flp pilus assembly protein TadG
VTIVEMTFVIIVALMFLFGIMEYGRYLMVLHIADNAAREGARFAVVHTGDGTQQSDVIAVVTSRMSGVDSNIQGYTVNVFAVKESGVYNSSGPIYPPTVASISQPPSTTDATTWNSALYGNGIAVQITGTYQPILPSFLLLNASLPVNVTSMMNSEAN